MGMGTRIQEEIIVDILSRLSVKSLLRFNCVSKSWKTLISEPYFKNKHLNHAKNHINFQKMLIGQTCYKDDTFYFYSSSLFSSDIHKFDDWPFNSKPWHGRVYCCCDGLFLIGIQSKQEVESSILLLWNPSTRESTILSHSELPPTELFIYGLGYDSTSDDYKVLRIDGYTNSQDEILLLKKNCPWRKLDEIPSMTCGALFLSHPMDCLAFLHGVFHWIGYMPSYTTTIGSFNISSEVYREIPLPKIMKKTYDMAGVFVWGGLLCYYNNDMGIFNLWIMKDYGVKESWMKSFTISNYDITPMYRFSDDEVLFRHITSTGRTVYYWISIGSFGIGYQVLPLELDNNTIQDSLVYTQSLISP